VIRLVHAALHALALLLGATTCLAAVTVHRSDAGQVPLGLLLGLAATFSAVWALWMSGAQRLTTSYAVGWLIVFGLVLAGKPEGDFAVAGDLPGSLMIAAAFAMVVVGIRSLTRRGSGPAQRRT